MSNLTQQDELNFNQPNTMKVVKVGRKVKVEPLVTREKLFSLIKDASPEKLQHIIGRALVVLFNNQTADERIANETVIHNNIGFTGADAKSGSLTAKYYKKHEKLEQWQVDRWLKISASGYPRLCKYHSQLNDAAMHKASAKEA